EDGEEVARDVPVVNLFDTVGPGVRERERLCRREGRERRCSRLPVHEVGGRDVVMRVAALSIVLEQSDHAVRPRERKRLEEHPIDDTEDRGRWADTDGERDERGKGKGGRCAERAERGNDGVGSTPCS